MAKIDVFFIVFIFGGLGFGYFLGLFRTISLFVALLIGYFVFPKFAATTFSFFIQLGFIQEHAQWASCLAIFLPILCLGWFVGSFGSKLLRILFLGWLDKMLGSLTGFFVVLLFISLSVVFMEYFLNNPVLEQRSWAEGSRLLPIFGRVGRFLLPEDFLNLMRINQGVMP